MPDAEQDITRQIKGLESHRSELLERKKDLQRRIKKLQGANHDVEGEAKIEHMKEEMSRVSSEKSRVGMKIKAKKWERHQASKDASPSDAGEWEERFIELAKENSDLKNELSKIRRSRKVARRKLEAYRELRSELSPILHVARVTKGDEDKNVYDSSSASIWLSDLWDVLEAAEDV